MGNNKNPDEKQPGEKAPGTFHYNPGNMSGKPIGANADESEKSNADKAQGHQGQEDESKGAKNKK